MGEKKLIYFLEELEEVAQGLQSALLERDTEEIWKAVDKHEESVDQLKAYCDQNASEIEGASKRNMKVRDLLGRSQSVLRTNRALTQTFLGVIDQTLSHLNGTNMDVAYPGYANSSRRSAPLLVSQQG